MQSRCRRLKQEQRVAQDELGKCCAGPCPIRPVPWCVQCANLWDRERIVSFGFGLVKAFLMPCEHLGKDLGWERSEDENHPGLEETHSKRLKKLIVYWRYDQRGLGICKHRKLKWEWWDGSSWGRGSIQTAKQENPDKWRTETHCWGVLKSISGGSEALFIQTSRVV